MVNPYLILFRLALVGALFLWGSVATAAERGRDIQRLGARVSNPAALVRFQDIRYRYFDLNDSRESRKIEAQGAFTPFPRFKVTHVLQAIRTDVSGDSDSDVSSLTLGATMIRDAHFVNRDARYFLGSQWSKDLGDVGDGTGSGSDLLAPFAGVTWQPTPEDFLVAMIQHSRSYRRDDGAPKVRKTVPRLIYIRGLRFLNGWTTFNLSGEFDHQDNDKFSPTLEMEIGTMLTPHVGFYGEIFVGDAVFDTEAYNAGIGLALRIVY